MSLSPSVCVCVSLSLSSNLHYLFPIVLLTHSFFSFTFFFPSRVSIIVIPISSHYSSTFTPLVSPQPAVSRPAPGWSCQFLMPTTRTPCSRRGRYASPWWRTRLWARSWGVSRPLTATPETTG